MHWLKVCLNEWTYLNAILNQNGMAEYHKGPKYNVLMLVECDWGLIGYLNANSYSKVLNECD